MIFPPLYYKFLLITSSKCLNQAFQKINFIDIINKAYDTKTLPNKFDIEQIYSNFFIQAGGAVEVLIFGFLLIFATSFIYQKNFFIFAYSPDETTSKIPRIIKFIYEKVITSIFMTIFILTAAVINFGFYIQIL